MKSTIKYVLAAGGLLLLLSACSAEIGSQAWCEDMQAKPKGEWTANEAGSYAKHCLLTQ